MAIRKEDTKGCRVQDAAKGVCDWPKKRGRTPVGHSADECDDECDDGGGGSCSGVGADAGDHDARTSPPVWL